MTIAATLENLIDRIAASRILSVLLLGIFTLLALLPGFASMPILDGAEPGFVVGGRAMVATGDVATVRLSTGSETLVWAARGGYWLAGLGDLIGGGALWGIRLPSIVAGLLVPILTWWAALGIVRPRGALFAGLFVAASGLFGLQSRLAMPDAMQLVFLVWAAGLMIRIWLTAAGGETARMAAGFWILLSLAFLVNGPAAPLALLVTALALMISKRALAADLKFRRGVLIVAIAVVVWVLLALAAWFSPFEYPGAAELRRLAVPSRIEAPPGLYILLAPLLLGPAITFILVALGFVVSNLGRPALALAFAWALPIWLMAEFWPDKQIHHILPALPAVGLLAGVVMDRDGAVIRGIFGSFYALALLVWPPVIAIGLTIAHLVLEGLLPLGGLLSLTGAAVLGPVAWIWLRGGHGRAASVSAIFSAMLIYWGFFGSMLPNLGVINVSGRVVAAGKEAVSCEPAIYTVAGFPEESMTFHLGDRVGFDDGEGAADFLETGRCRIAAVERAQLGSFRQRADDLGLELLDHAQIVGINLRRLTGAEVHLFTLESIGR